MRLAGSGRAYEMHGFGAIWVNCSPASARIRLLSSEGWKAKSKPVRVLIAESLAILDGHFDAAVLPDGELFGQQRVDSLDGADFAALDATQRDVEYLQGAWHFQSDEARFDA